MAFLSTNHWLDPVPAKHSGSGSRSKALHQSVRYLQERRRVPETVTAEIDPEKLKMATRSFGEKVVTGTRTLYSATFTPIRRDTGTVYFALYCSSRMIISPLIFLLMNESCAKE